LFVTSRHGMPAYVAVFAIMTALWCAIGFKLASHRAVAGKIRLHGHLALPVVLILLGAYILSGARVLLTPVG